MANYANQKRALTREEEKKNCLPRQERNDSFCYIRWDVMKKAMRLLTGNGYKLYCYFISWFGAKEFMFSKADVIKQVGLGGEKAVGLALQNLKDKGFLTEENNTYLFHPISLTEP